ncbi:pentapeptide repeat-containing protein [Streptomyces sp. NPDC050625]|uniref:pentapeptide repeat-containing protein n=1 Tax=Streptomyces sp. NPDC050625 TaxID=3154629 RepID=UPI003416C22C
MDKKWWSRVPLWLWWLLVALGGVAAAGVALWRVPWWIDHQYLNSELSPAVATTVTGIRTAMVALGAGGLAVVGILYTHRAWHQAREGQVTDRYTKAIGQIASDKPVEQLGGIYALERIMRDSPKDHTTIVEVLAAFVREHAPASIEPSPHDRFRAALRPLRAGMSGARAPSGRTTQQSAPPHPSEPVQAALTVLGRRPSGRDEPFGVQLPRTDLRGASLVEAQLTGVNLSGAHLERANLSGAHLERANLDNAHLEGASFFSAHLEWANLRQAHLEQAILDNAHLEGVNLFSAHLEGANLNNAHLEGATLFLAHLEGANLRRAHLERVDLDQAHLERAYLAKAHLERASLDNAYLKQANLEGAHLEEARDLTTGQLVGAFPWESTGLPADLAADAAVRARVAQVEKEGQAMWEALWVGAHGDGHIRLSSLFRRKGR